MDRSIQVRVMMHCMCVVWRPSQRVTRIQPTETDLRCRQCSFLDCKQCFFWHGSQAFSASLRSRSAAHLLCLCVWHCPYCPVRNMDLPIAMATRPSELKSLFDLDLDSDLSDPPSDLDNMDFSINDGVEQMELDDPSLKRKSTATSHSENTSMIDLSNEQTSHPNPAKRQRLSYQSHVPSQTLVPSQPVIPSQALVPYRSLVRIEDFPNEILQRIAFELEDPQDLTTFALLCKKTADAVMPDTSAVYKARFLSEYDHPCFSNEKEEKYCFAYKMRTLTLKRFVAFDDPDDKRLPEQLEALRLMVVETYFQLAKHLPPPTVSFNLARFADVKSGWMATFLSCPFYPTKPRSRYGDIHHLFTALQLVLSHLLLSPASDMAYKVPTSRQNYNVDMVYNWGFEFETLYRKFQGQFVLDTYELLHIRNFWHRHLIDYPPGEAKEDFIKRSSNTFEHTYAKMARELWAVGITAKPWDKFLEDGLPKEIPLVWYGHYSCARPWPKKSIDLAEMQSVAEDWTSVDPLKLDLTTNIIAATKGATDAAINDARDGFWPESFSNIPVFAETIPQFGPRAFIKGIAQFVDNKTDSMAELVATRPPQPNRQQAILYTSNLPKYHSYLSLRIRGVIHPIAAQPEPEPDVQGQGDDKSIPGWNRIVMVMYKPSTEYLIRVLEYADGDYGGAFGPALANLNRDHMTDEEIEAELMNHLDQKLAAHPARRDGIDRDKIEQMEEKYQKSKDMSWDDIEYAYAYEGVMLPGGKIMMGRWWRCANWGEGEGCEVVEEDNGHRKLERGPFVFWAA
ncbi:hypothetical protein PV11_09561 [Exophiala sideris]|uniref:Uncharacterized protein n=1 Tax=Exophiala sideris TaxID=1016849 RepID=A0A0D1WRT0_9EURO|nr:hypothetical protein PV11_09561 [Exophiala sideris]